MSYSIPNNVSTSRHEYPGLGLPLRHDGRGGSGSYPIGGHDNCYGSASDIISVRELAMMNVMEKLTDKEDWHKKVFDDNIVAKWRDKALAIPDKQYWDLATRAKRQLWIQGHDEPQIDDSRSGFVRKLEHIMDEPTFEAVSICYYYVHASH